METAQLEHHLALLIAWGAVLKRYLVVGGVCTGLVRWLATQISSISSISDRYIPYQCQLLSWRSNISIGTSYR